MMRSSRIALFAASLVVAALMTARGQAPAGGDTPKKTVLVELFTSQG